jgi:hypothetical protein
MPYKPTSAGSDSNLSGAGLNGHDKQQGAQVDRRGGARDAPPASRSEKATPEGLRRKPKGPYNPSSGRH